MSGNSDSGCNSISSREKKLVEANGKTPVQLYYFRIRVIVRRLLIEMNGTQQQNEKRFADTVCFGDPTGSMR